MEVSCKEGGKGLVLGRTGWVGDVVEECHTMADPETCAGIASICTSRSTPILLCARGGGSLESSR